MMLVTSLKPMERDPPRQPVRAADGADLRRLGAGLERRPAPALECTGIQVGFWNSVKIVVPSTDPVDLSRRAERLCAVVLAPRGANLLFGVLMFGAFVPYQVMMYPLVRSFATLNLFGTCPASC
jgi:glucose/mannose transport system permease protein